MPSNAPRAGHAVQRCTIQRTVSSSPGRKGFPAATTARASRAQRAESTPAAASLCRRRCEACPSVAPVVSWRKFAGSVLMGEFAIRCVRPSLPSVKYQVCNYSPFFCTQGRLLWCSVMPLPVQRFKTLTCLTKFSLLSTAELYWAFHSGRQASVTVLPMQLTSRQFVSAPALPTRTRDLLASVCSGFGPEGVNRSRRNRALDELDGCGSQARGACRWSTWDDASGWPTEDNASAAGGIPHRVCPSTGRGEVASGVARWAAARERALSVASRTGPIPLDVVNCTRPAALT